MVGMFQIYVAAAKLDRLLTSRNLNWSYVGLPECLARQKLPGLTGFAGVNLPVARVCFS